MGEQKTAGHPAAAGQSVAESVRALLSGIVDYAGLYPPASLPLHEAISRYDSYFRSPFSWMLGRLILPASRIGEFEKLRSSIPFTNAWRLSAIVGTNAKDDLQEVRRFNDRNCGKGDEIDCIEAQMPSEEAASDLKIGVSPGLTAYFEVAPTVDVGILRRIKSLGGKAKIRTGGVKPDAIPKSAQIAQFLVNCASEELAFKATAGLHHPLRCQKPLTYEKDSPQARMHGFLGLFLAAVQARNGTPANKLVACIDADQGREFRFGDSEVLWKNVVITTEMISETRHRFAISFGSCSFEEPIEDLKGLQLL